MTTEPWPVAASAEHLTLALHRAGVLDDNHVASVVVESSRDMVLSQIKRLRLHYHAACDAPQTLILKTELHERAGLGAEGGRHEVEFYARIAPAMSARLTPACFEASWASDTKAWHLLLEDLSDSHVLATQWPLPPTSIQCQSIIVARAHVHAIWWNDPRLGTSIGSQPDSGQIDRQVQRLAGQFAKFADFMGGRMPRERVELFERWLDKGQHLLAGAFGGPNRTLVHGDAHVWNCFLPRDEHSRDVRLFDWDSWRIGTGAIDLAYMMAVHWYPGLRRERERQLLDRYHAALAEHGVSSYDRIALQTDYRAAVLWQIMTPVMQHAYGIPPVIWWNNLERILLAVDDLKCRDLLG